MIRGGGHIFEHNLAVYRRVWRGSVFVSFIAPILFLAAMGLGLGTLVRRGPISGTTYLAFLGPGLLAANAMQTATIETTYPIMGKLKWLRTYEGMLSTPLAVTDILLGELLWVLARLGMVVTIFFVVMLAFGIVRSPLAPLAIPAALLTGLAFAAPILAFTATQVNANGFVHLNRFGILPLFLLGGTFFPLDRLPGWLHAVALATPLAHGVALTRSLTLGTGDLASAAADVGLLLVYAAGGIAVARFTLRRRLRT